MNSSRTPFYIFNRLCIEYSNVLFRDVLKTPPIETDPASSNVLFSILQKKDVCAYLLAVKSFLRFTPPFNVIVQSDGSLDDEACREIRKHLPHVQFLSRESTEELVRSRASKSLIRLLRDTNWWVEFKLLNPLFRFQEKYVVLFDSDLLFMKSPGAVLDCIRASPQRAFYCPGGNALAEPFHRLGFEFPKVDIRSFNAGFIGFLNDISLEQVELIGEKIREREPSLLRYYDIEQALWSVLLNQTESPVNLKSVHHDYVGNGWSDFAVLSETCVMAHFVGATRFRNLMYNRLARIVCRELQAK